MITHVVPISCPAHAFSISFLWVQGLLSLTELIKMSSLMYDNKHDNKINAVWYICNVGKSRR